MPPLELTILALRLVSVLMLASAAWAMNDPQPKPMGYTLYALAVGAELTLTRLMKRGAAKRTEVHDRSTI